MTEATKGGKREREKQKNKKNRSYVHRYGMKWVFVSVSLYPPTFAMGWVHVEYLQPQVDHNYLQLCDDFEGKKHQSGFPVGQVQLVNGRTPPNYSTTCHRCTSATAACIRLQPYKARTLVTHRRGGVGMRRVSILPQMLLVQMQDAYSNRQCTIGKEQCE